MLRASQKDPWFISQSLQVAEGRVAHKPMLMGTDFEISIRPSNLGSQDPDIVTLCVCACVCVHVCMCVGGASGLPHWMVWG